MTSPVMGKPSRRAQKKDSQHTTQSTILVQQLMVEGYVFAIKFC